MTKLGNGYEASLPLEASALLGFSLTVWLAYETNQGSPKPIVHDFNVFYR